MFLAGFAPPECLSLSREWPRVLAAIRQEHLAWLPQELQAALESEVDLPTCILTAVDEGFPAQWHALGGTAPPALWLAGASPTGRETFGAIVGSREIGSRESRVATEAAQTLIEAGGTVVSGGAPGVDRAARKAAQSSRADQLSLLEIWPCGLSDGRWGHSLVAPDRVCLVSACAPRDPFDRGRAMERNKWILAAASAALVVHARPGRGGSWQAALTALKRGWPRVYVPADWPDAPGNRALLDCGALPYPGAEAWAHEVMSARAPLGLV